MHKEKMTNGVVLIYSKCFSKFYLVLSCFPVKQKSLRSSKLGEARSRNLPKPSKCMCGRYLFEQSLENKGIP